MTALPTLRLRTQVQFPASVAGNGGITVTKENGIWIVEPDFSGLTEVVGSSVSDPTSKQIWIFDPTSEEYNVLTLAGLGDSLYMATSVTSLTIGSGSKAFTTQPGKDFGVGSYVLASSDADPTNYMLGRVTAYSGATLTISVPSLGFGGSGTYADWTLRMAGAPGSLTIPGVAFTWSTSTASSDPGTGAIKVNNASLASATAIYISETDADANNLAAWLATWDDGTSTIKGTLKLTKANLLTSFVIFNITGTITDNGTWDTFAATYVSHGGSFSSGDALKLEFYRAGDAGAGDFSSNTSSSVDGEMVLFSGTGGKTGKRSTLTGGMLKSTSGVPAIATAGTDYVKPDTTSNFSKGMTHTEFDNGTKSSGTFTPDMTNGQVQKYVDGGAHTLAAPSGVGYMVLTVTNASGGTITFTGFDTETGDAHSATGTKVYTFHITITGSHKHIHRVYKTAS